MAVDSFRNARDAWRALARSPGLIVAAVASLGIGIGANLTMFGVLRAIEFPVLPYPDASRLVQIDASSTVRGASGYPVSLPDFDDIRRASRSFAAIAVSADETMTLRGGAEPARIAVKRVPLLPGAREARERRIFRHVRHAGRGWPGLRCR